MQIRVETADLRNLEELLKIERECFTEEAFSREQMAILLGKPNAISLSARIDGEVAGFIICVLENHGAVTVGHIYTIDVAPKHRRRGVGVRLLKEMENAFLRKGVAICYLEVRVDNQAARRLYRRLDYVEVEPLDNYYSKGVHGFRLKKRLKP